MSTQSRMRQHLREAFHHGHVLSKTEHLERPALRRTGSMPDLYSVPVGTVIGSKAVVEQGKKKRVLVGVEKALEMWNRQHPQQSTQKEEGNVGSRAD